jgi:hypothetical protein
MVPYNANVPLLEDGNVEASGSRYRPAELKVPMAAKFSRMWKGGPGARDIFLVIVMALYCWGFGVGCWELDVR